MSALVQKRTKCCSASNVRFVPIATDAPQQTAALFDNLVGDGEHRGRHHDVERSRGLKVDDEFEFGKLGDREVGGLCAIEDAASVDADSTKHVRDVGSVAHQPADFDITTVRKSHRNAVVRRQDGNLYAAAVEESVSSDEEGIETLGRKGRRDLADRLGVEDLSLQPDGTGG